ncbi:hypothetical protein CE91St41_29180 [Oscillospiraceae bacterium]|nr:hypothetical protein CE91St40_29180 [Oscillospiraceae bacterium]BDF76029.1 hypothetical protein CE91St41_29180 [Oscillospiraceae bacterium]
MAQKGDKTLQCGGITVEIRYAARGGTLEECVRAYLEGVRGQ